jgi:protein-tyrosine phosphatase
LKSILVLCEGNHCRSPIAEALLRDALGPGIQVVSAGLGALVGEPADRAAQDVAKAHGLDLSSHRGRQWSDAMALRADLVLVMEERQKTLCESILPSVRGRVFLLGHWLEGPQREIPDPYLLGPEAAQAAFGHIHQAVASWLPRLANLQRPL